MDNTPLKIEELKVGQMYTCLLSGKKVIVCMGYTEQATFGGTQRVPNGKPYLKYFNTMSDSYSTSEIADYQLAEI